MQLFLLENNILTRRHLAARHRVTVRQMQWRHRIVWQQLAAPFERGTGSVDVTGVE